MTVDGTIYRIPRNVYAVGGNYRDITIANLAVTPLWPGQTHWPDSPARGYVPGWGANQIIPWPGTYAFVVVQCVAKASLVDGETFTLHGVHPTTGLEQVVVFEFDLPPDGIGGDVVVDVSGDTSAQDVCDTCVAAINALPHTTLNGSAVPGPVSASFAFFASFPGTAGNMPVEETVANAGFTINGDTVSSDMIRGLNPSAVTPERFGKRYSFALNDGPCDECPYWGNQPGGNNWPPNQYCDPPIQL